MSARRSEFGWIFRRRKGDGKAVPMGYRGQVRAGYYVRVRAGTKTVVRKAGSTREEARMFLSALQRALCPIASIAFTHRRRERCERGRWRGGSEVDSGPPLVLRCHAPG